MNQYRVRAEIYNPTEILGVRDSDLKWVGLLTIIALTIPFVFELFIGPIPVSAITTPFTLAGSLLFFNWARIGKRPKFLEYKLKNLRKVQLHRRWTTKDLQKNCQRFLES